MLLSVSEQMFTQEVLEASTPVLVHFWAPWCGLCKLIMPQLRQFQEDWRGKVKLVAVNADQSLKLATTYRLQTLPTLIVFDRGQVLYRLDHFQGREDLRRSLDTFMVSYQNCQQTRQTQEVLPLEA
ncbi:MULTISPECIES: thioredoxin family protein [Planktothrix]|uniref:Thioredoxin fold domain-containing protein n=1 Tax=Planktothrix mougeotii LEGE 06226 TaxID=1828728 RepID=A0ABR9UAM7_9CYAN|nr:MULTISPECIES: thioredoxin domain-containing protein [Planktothrix]MBD2483177.1 thioredoxin fold domain-containing protein [Planktothrix sp. FACHB-1365]MBE9143515.1 thioredoxin fold domain-containing protein [Planktothrix mougeotii LEGE 06226]